MIRILRLALLPVVGLTAIGVTIQFLVPRSPAGCWTGGEGFFGACGRDAHHFIRFHDGVATKYDERSDTADRVTYSRIGRGLWRYDWHDVRWSPDKLSYSLDTNTFWTVRPGWLHLRIAVDTNTFTLRRDLNFRKTRSIVAAVKSFKTQDERMAHLAGMRREKQKVQQSAAPLPPAPRTGPSEGAR